MTHALKKSVLLLALAFLASPTAAQAGTRITEEAVEAFYKQSAEIYKLPYSEYSEFMQSMMTDGFSSTIKTTVNIEGRPPITQTINDSKTSVLKNARTSYDVMRNGTVLNKVMKVAVSDDGHSANVGCTKA